MAGDKKMTEIVHLYHTIAKKNLVCDASEVVHQPDAGKFDYFS